MLRGENGNQRKELAKLIRWARSQPRPGVIVLPNSMLISLALPLKRALGAPVCCNLQGEDLFLEELQEPWRSTSLDLIRAAVGHVDLFLPTSDYYAGFMSGYLDIPRERLHTVPLGINLAGYERVARDPRRPFTAGYFARIDPAKGLHLLAAAYRRFRRLYPGPARLEAAGYIAPEHKPYLEGIEKQMAEWGLGGEFAWRGVLDRESKIAFLQQLDVLSVPGDYADPKGIYLLEAMACGVPFIQPAHGAFPELHAATGAGELVPPGDISALAAALARFAGDPEMARRLGDTAYHAVRRNYSVAHMAARALEAYSRCSLPTTSPNPTTRPEVPSLSSPA
jgi:glycosyltransferase involved in cell wall biosynthesis